jgi:hypothetical protein
MREHDSIWRIASRALAVERSMERPGCEDRPWNRIERLRSRLGLGALGYIETGFCWLSLWLSLPLAIWLSSGWMGLLIHWQASLRIGWVLARAANRAQSEWLKGPAGEQGLL